MKQVGCRGHPRPQALLKMGDRLDDASRGDLKPIVDKDALDVLRLPQPRVGSLQTCAA